MKNKTVKAIIFDFDGTIVNTEEICAQLHPILFKKYGYSLTKEQTLALRSAGYPLRQALVAEWFNPKDSEKLVKKIEKKLHKYIKKWSNIMPVKLKPGCLEILKYLTTKNMPIVIATSSVVEHVEKRLIQLNIRQYFTNIYSSKDLKYGKPEPDIYEYVCAQLRLEPGECLAIEDCPNGVKSACLAGCQTVMIPDLTEPDKELKKKYKFKVAKNLLALKRII